MTEAQKRRWRSVAVPAALAVAMTAACATSRPSRAATPSVPAQQDPTRALVIDHLTPARDSVGPVPTRFVWTAVPGADSYSVGIWNEVDRLIWRQNNIQTTSVEGPGAAELEPGTYFWTISALRDGNQIAESGLAAFVVRTNP